MSVMKYLHFFFLLYLIIFVLKRKVNANNTMTIINCVFSLFNHIFTGGFCVFAEKIFCVEMTLKVWYDIFVEM